MRGSATARQAPNGKAKYEVQRSTFNVAGANADARRRQGLFAKPFGWMPGFAREKSEGVY